MVTSWRQGVKFLYQSTSCSGLTLANPCCSRREEPFVDANSMQFRCDSCENPWRLTQRPRVSEADEPGGPIDVFAIVRCDGRVPLHPTRR